MAGLTWLRRFFGRREVPVLTAPAPIARAPRTHYVLMDGIRCGVLRAGMVAPNVVLSGRTAAHWGWQAGDYLVLHTEFRLSARYEVLKLTRPGGDLYFAECRFAPRGLGEKTVVKHGVIEP